MNEYIEEICKRLRDCVAEYGQAALTTAIIIGPEVGIKQIGGHDYIYAPTVAMETLGNVQWEVARCFEDS